MPTRREAIAAYVQRLLAEAPPLSPAQRARIAAVFAAAPPAAVHGKAAA